MNNSTLYKIWWPEKGGYMMRAHYGCPFYKTKIGAQAVINRRPLLKANGAEVHKFEIKRAEDDS